ncbi:MAG: hypothetical protein ACW97Z_01870 [Candidatus Hodarchaeales archaeon]|jgi:hypothetical protein
MNRKYFILITFLLSLTFFSQSLAPVASQTSGSFYGFDFEYGEQTRNFTKSVAYSQSFSESESNTKTREFTIQAPIRTGLEVIDVFWQRWTNRSKSMPSSTWERPGTPQNWRGYRADGYLTNGTDAGGAWYRYHGITELNWNTFSQSLNISWFGRQIDIGLAEKWISPTWLTSYAILTEVGTVDVPMQDWLGTAYDYATLQKYHIAYVFDKGTPLDFNDDEVVFQEILIPKFVFIRVKTTKMSVEVTETSTVAASLSGQFNFSGSWTENLYGQHVSIKDGRNYWYDYFALISGNVDYDYSAGFTLDGSLSTNVTRDVTFSSNGSVVPESIRPIHLQSLRLVLAGFWDFYEEESGVLYGEGAIQSMIQVLLTKASTETSPNLAVWGNFNPGRVIGYRDVDGDEILTAYLNESYIATPDAIMAVGIPEGAHIEGSYYGNGVANARVYTSLGDWIIADNKTDILRSIDRPFEETWGYDPRRPEAGPKSVSLNWNAPVKENGKAIFSWETTYDDMPITWWARNSSLERVSHDLTDITYGYSLTIAPEAGLSTLESTYQQSGIQNPQLKEMISSQELSMAAYRRDYYLSITQISQDASGSFARPESEFDLTVAGKDLFSQNFGGTKEQYYLVNDPSTTYSSGTSVMNLLTAEGFSGEPTNQTARNPYSSPISKRIAAGLTQWSADTHTQDISWLFRENLVITSYPTWNGEGIVHDPVYTASYEGTGSHEESTTDESEAGVPGFSFILPIVILVVASFGLKKRRQ